jgi:hypothetical protein
MASTSAWVASGCLYLLAWSGAAQRLSHLELLVVIAHLDIAASWSVLHICATCQAVHVQAQASSGCRYSHETGQKALQKAATALAADVDHAQGGRWRVREQVAAEDRGHYGFLGLDASKFRNLLPTHAKVGIPPGSDPAAVPDHHLCYLIPEVVVNKVCASACCSF